MNNDINNNMNYYIEHGGARLNAGILNLVTSTQPAALEAQIAIGTEFHNINGVTNINFDSGNDTSFTGLTGLGLKVAGAAVLGVGVFYSYNRYKANITSELLEQLQKSMDDATEGRKYVQNEIQKCEEQIPLWYIEMNQLNREISLNISLNDERIRRINMIADASISEENINRIEEDINRIVEDINKYMKEHDTLIKSRDHSEKQYDSWRNRYYEAQKVLMDSNRFINQIADILSNEAKRQEQDRERHDKICKVGLLMVDAAIIGGMALASVMSSDTSLDRS